MILTLNSGSSSLKFALYSFEPDEALALSGKLDRIGLPAGAFQAWGARGERLAAEELPLPDHDAALVRQLVPFDAGLLTELAVGKPLIAVEMTQHDLRPGLHAPLRLPLRAIRGRTE